MRYQILILFTLTFRLCCYSQVTEDTLKARLGLYGQRLPADQVFLHTDRNIYYPGDTIHFHGYIRDRQTGIFETGSVSLYTMLVSENRKTVDSARFRIDNSTASGWLKVPDAMTPGDFNLLSFTSGMMNYGPEYVFSAPVRISRKRVFQSRLEKMPKNGDSLKFINALDAEKIDMKFLPEGGTFIYGISQRIAYNAVTESGSSLQCRGKIYNQRGDYITDFSSGRFSPGSFEITPEKGDTYFAVPGGREFEGLKWSLPVPAESGIALRIGKAAYDIVEVEVHGQGIAGSHWYLTMVMNDVLVFYTQFTTDSLWKVKISTAELPAGTAYITISNSKAEPVAERPVFINMHKRINVDIKPVAPLSGRGSEKSISINATGSKGETVAAVVSLSAADSAYGFADNIALQNIESAFLLDNQFFNNLPGKIRQQGIFNIDEKELDLLLLTYGWRKYEHKEEETEMIDTEVTGYDYITIENPGPQKRTRSEITLTTLEGGEVISLKKDKEGKAILPFTDLDTRVRQIMILPDKNPSANAYGINIRFPENDEFIKKVKKIRAVTIPPENEFTVRDISEKVILIDSAIQIEEVTIRAPIKPAVVFYDKYQRIYQYASLKTLSKRELAGCLSLEDVLIRLHPWHLDTRNKKIYLRSSPNLQGFSPPALFVFDDVPMETSYELISTIPVSQISSVTALRGTQGFSIYGNAAIGGVVFVTTGWKKMADGDMTDDDLIPARKEDDLLKAITVFRKEAEYYIPSKEEVSFIPEYQVRPTLYWNDEILLDGKGPVTVTFPNHMLPGKIIIIANGVSFTNMPGVGKASYVIK